MKTSFAQRLNVTKKKVGQKSRTLTGKCVHSNGTQMLVEIFTKPILNN